MQTVLEIIWHEICTLRWYKYAFSPNGGYSLC